MAETPQVHDSECAWVNDRKGCSCGVGFTLETGNILAERVLALEAELKDGREKFRDEIASAIGHETLRRLLPGSKKGAS